MSTPNEAIDPRDIEYVDTDVRWLDKDSTSIVYDEDIEEVSFFIQEKKLPPSDDLQQAFSLGVAYINKIRGDIGLRSIEPEAFQYAILPPTDYDEAIKRLTNGTRDGQGLLGSQIDDLEMVIIKNADSPVYITASTAVHEWVHAFIDRKIHVLGTDKDGSQSEEYRRSGLSVAKIPPPGHLGKLLNEMGNHLLESEFQAQLLKHPICNRENQLREKSLSRLHFRRDNPDLYDFVANIDNGRRVIPGILSRKNIHFNRDGSWSTQSYFFLIQLGDDLSQLTNRDSQGSFKQLLIESKVYPERQNELRKLVDSVMGKGFYFRLKQATLDIANVLPLLKEVQDKLYPRGK